MDVVAALALGLTFVNAVALMLVAREVAALRMSRVSRGIPLGREIPNVEAPTRAGGIGRSADLRQRVLLFVAPDCESCHDLVNEIRVAEMSLPLTVAVTSRHEIAPTEPFLDTLAFLSPSHVWVDSSRRIFGQFEAPVTPFAYAIDRNGRVGGRDAPLRADDLRRMATFAVR